MSFGNLFPFSKLIEISLKLEYANYLFVAYHRLKKEENVSKTINRNLNIHMAHSFNYNFVNLQSQSIKGYVRFHTFRLSNTRLRLSHKYEAIIYNTLIIIRISNKIYKIFDASLVRGLKDWIDGFELDDIAIHYTLLKLSLKRLILKIDLTDWYNKRKLV